MAIAVHADEERRLLVVSVSGVLTDQELEGVHIWRQHELYKAGCPVLADCTRLTGGEVKITSAAIYELKEITASDANLVAIVATDPVARGMARMYEIVSNGSVERVAVFREMDAAFRWLDVKRTSAT
jgi:hypothetical protein